MRIRCYLSRAITFPWKHIKDITDIQGSLTFRFTLCCTSYMLPRKTMLDHPHFILECSLGDVGCQYVWSDNAGRVCVFNSFPHCVIVPVKITHTLSCWLLYLCLCLLERTVWQALIQMTCTICEVTETPRELEVKITGTILFAQLHRHASGGKCMHSKFRRESWAIEGQNGWV